MSTIRPHFLSEGDALNRRKLAELFLDAARRTFEIDNAAYGDNVLKRPNFALDTFEEYLANFQVSIAYVTPDYGHQIPGSALETINDDSYFEGELAWSIEVEAAEVGSFHLHAWPVVDGQAIWAGDDWITVDQLYTYAEPVLTELDPEEPGLMPDFVASTDMSMGNIVTVNGLNGRSYFGVLVASRGSFTINKCQVQMRKVTR